MSILADAVQPHIVASLFTIQGKVDQTLDDLIGRRSAFYPSFDEPTEKWDLNFVSSDNVAMFIANESSRFACASFQSYSDVASQFENGDCAPWALVRAYYSAYYAGHSILRLIGSTCTYVDRSRAGALREVIAAYGLSKVFGVGQYEIALDRAGTGLSFQILGASLGGSHDQFWYVFGKRLATLERDVLHGPLPQVDAQRVWDCLGRLRGLLCKNSLNGGWLSAIRNSVQYKQAMGVWFPDRLSSRDLDALSRAARHWKDDPLSIRLSSEKSNELGDFLTACTFLVSMCRVLMMRIGERGKRGRARSFADYGPLRFLNTRDLM
jgi:hypothetical protein